MKVQYMSLRERKRENSIAKIFGYSLPWRKSKYKWKNKAI